MMISENLVDWIMFHGDPVYDGTPQTARDNHIYDDGSHWWMVNTTVGWEGGTSFALLRSSDLVSWTKITDVDCSAIGSVSRTWSPIWFKDDDDSLHVFVSCDHIDSNFHLYELHPTNAGMTTWSEPVQLTGTGLPDTQISGFFLKIESTYYCFAKNENTKYIEVMFSTSLLTGWAMYKTSDWAGWGSQIEGGCVLKYGSRWWMFADKYNPETGMMYSYSDDNWNSWSPLTPLVTPFAHAKNGVVIRKTR